MIFKVFFRNTEIALIQLKNTAKKAKSYHYEQRQKPKELNNSHPLLAFALAFIINLDKTCTMKNSSIFLWTDFLCFLSWNLLNLFRNRNSEKSQCYQVFATRRKSRGNMIPLILIQAWKIFEPSWLAFLNELRVTPLLLLLKIRYN